VPSFSDIAKALIKVGAKATVPVLGDVIATGLEQTGGLLAEDYGVRRAKQFQDRLIAEIQNDLERACPSEGVSDNQLTAVLATAQDALARYVLSIPEWTDVRFDRREHVGASLSRHKRAGRIEVRDAKLYSIQSTSTEQQAAVRVSSLTAPWLSRACTR
jgi:hypothetical protein